MQPATSWDVAGIIQRDPPPRDWTLPALSGLTRAKMKSIGAFGKAGGSSPLAAHTCHPALPIAPR